MSYSYIIIRYTRDTHLLTLPKALKLFFCDNALMKTAVTSLRSNGIQCCHPSCIKHSLFLFVCFVKATGEKRTYLVGPSLRASIWDVTTSDTK